MIQYPQEGFRQVLFYLQCRQRQLLAGNVLLHFRWLAEQYGHGQIHRRGSQLPIGHGHVTVVPGRTHHGKGAAFPLTDLRKAGQVSLRDCQHIAFLRFIAPDLKGRHARLVTGYRPQLEVATDPTILDQLRQGIG